MKLYDIIKSPDLFMALDLESQQQISSEYDNSIILNSSVCSISTE